MVAHLLWYQIKYFWVQLDGLYGIFRFNETLSKQFEKTTKQTNG